MKSNEDIPEPEQKKPGLPFGVARNAPLVPAGDAWWAPLSDEDADAWIDGR